MHGDGPAGWTSPHPSNTVSVVLAVLNERRSLPLLVDEVLHERPAGTEIIVVDDGSTDGTREWLKQASQSDPRVRPLFNPAAQTLTPAQCQGIRVAVGDYVVVMDADLQHPPGVVCKLVNELRSGADLVIASRYTAGGQVVSRSDVRAIISLGAEWTARAFLPSARRVSDPMSGFFAFRRSAYQDIDPRYRGYKLLLYLLAMCQNRRIVEVPYVFQPRGNGSSKILRNLGFIRIFLTEVLLAKRMEVAVRRAPNGHSEAHSESVTYKADHWRWTR
jgi:dolichol-phosphate mannosyltransferase